MSSCNPQRLKERARNLTEENSGVNTSKGKNFKLKQKPVKKLSIKKKKELEELDSFKYLNDTKKCNDLDNKIKLLKLELMSLIGNTSSEQKISTSSEQKRKDIADTPDFNSSVRESFVEEKGKAFNISSLSPCDSVQILQTKDIGISSDNELSHEITKHSNCHSPTKFSQWLDTTIDLIDSEVKSLGAKKNEGICASKIKNLNLLYKSSATSSDYINCESRSSNLTHEPEKLLYESFLIKNLDKYLSSSDESTQDKIKSSVSGLRKQKSKVRRKLSQKTTLKKRKSIFSQKKGKKLRVAQNFSDNIVEIIDINPNHSTLGAAQTLKNEALDLDLENLEWDEPFDLDKKDDSYLSDIEIMVSDTEVICISPEETAANGKEKQVNRKGKNIEGGKKKSWECPICFESSTGQEVVTTLCGHVYCKQCLETYHSTTSKSCPSCRTDLSGQPLVTLFNL